MNLNNSVRRFPVIGRPLNALLKRHKKGSRIGIRVAANAVTVHLGPYSASFFPGGRGITRAEVIERGPRDWHLSVMATIEGFHFLASLDRSPTWRKQYR